MGSNLFVHAGSCCRLVGLDVMRAKVSGLGQGCGCLNLLT